MLLMIRQTKRLHMHFPDIWWKSKCLIFNENNFLHKTAKRYLQSHIILI